MHESPERYFLRRRLQPTLPAAGDGEGVVVEVGTYRYSTPKPAKTDQTKLALRTSKITVESYGKCQSPFRISLRYGVATCGGESGHVSHGDGTEKCQFGTEKCQFRTEMSVQN
jgi:hypothetical protein